MASLALSFDSPVDPPLPDWHLGLRLEQNEVHFPFPIILKLKLSSAMIRSDFSFTRRHVKVKPFCPLLPSTAPTTCLTLQLFPSGPLAINRDFHRVCSVMCVEREGEGTRWQTT